MKNEIYIFSILLLCCITTFGQAPDYEWAISAGTPYVWDGANRIRVDANGNSYVTGHFFGTYLVLGNDTFYGPAGGGNLFVAKYDFSGNLLWARSQSGALCGIYDIALDANANLYITGAFSSDSVTFGNITLTNSAASYNDIFIVKYDSSGNVIWAKGVGGTLHEYPYSIATDVNSNIYIAGNFDSDSITFGATTIVRAVNGSAYVVKYDSSGNVIWAKGAGAGPGIYVSAITSDVKGNAYLTGNFAIPVAFDSITLTSHGSADIFIAKYDSSGNVVWARNDGGSLQDYGIDIASDAIGNIYLVGTFNSASVIFGTTTLNADWEDIFIVKYDSSGNALWAHKAGGASVDEGNSIDIDANGNSYISGDFDSDTIAFGNNTFANHGMTDFTIAKYDSTGNFIWARSNGGGHNDGCPSVAADNNGNLYIAGGFGSHIMHLGNFTLTNTSTGYAADIFVAKLGNTTGIPQENNFFNEMNIFPNPSNGNLQITSADIIDEIEIRNVLGQNIYSAKPNEKNVKLKIDDDGMYFVTAKSGKQITTKKLIIQL